MSYWRWRNPTGFRKKILIYFCIPFLLILAIDIGWNSYKGYQNKYMVIKDSVTYRASFVGTPKFKFEAKGRVKKGQVVYRAESLEQPSLTKKYYKVDKEPRRGGTLGYVLKENLKKLEKK